jgi:pimeloyl-ACP methyl ester carboxylesterase
LNPFFYAMPFVQLHLFQLHYEEITVVNTRQNSPVIVFLHEALGSIPQWKDFPQLLCDDLQLNGIVYERQGYGKSSELTAERDASYLHKYAQEELPPFLAERYPEDQQFILVGHSDGGTIALLYAATYPEKVKSVITMAAHVINEPETIAGIAPAVDAFEKGKLDKLFNYHGDKTKVLFYAWAKTWLADDFLNWNICEDISSIQTPSLILQGAQDQYGTSKQLELIKSNVKGNCDTILINECGHHPHLEQKNHTISLIKHWYLGTSSQH